MRTHPENHHGPRPARGRTFAVAVLAACAIMAPTLPTPAVGAPMPALGGPSITAAPRAAAVTSTSARLNVRMRAYVKLKKKLTGSKKVQVTFKSRRNGASAYAARVTFKRSTATLQWLSYDASGRATKLGGSVTVATKVKPKRRVYLQTEVVETTGATTLQAKSWASGQKARVVTRTDTRAGRPSKAGTTSLSVKRSAKVRKPKVRELGVSQPPNTVTPAAPATPAPKPVVPTGGGTLPPNPNPGHSSWPGRVARVIDGDTIDVFLDGSSKPVQVRNAGIQAMETGQCHGASASAALSSLTPAGSRVLLTARYASSTSTVGGVVRLLRFIYVLRDGKWVDTQLALLQKGEVLWYPIPPEYANSKTYREAMERAASAKVGMFAPARACGTPSTMSIPQIWINYDGDGDENVAVNSEYIRLYNPSSANVDLSTWWIRDGSQHHAIIPSGTVIKPRGTLTLHVGKGTNSPSTGHLYWGWTGPRFQNTIDAPTGRRVSDPPGNTAYLFDPRGNVRALTTYPCVTCGSHPLRGKVALTVRPTGSAEAITVRNTSSDSIDLSFQVLQARGSVYEIRPATVLSRGEVLTVHMRTGTATRLTQYWGKKAEYNLPDSGGEIRLRSVRDTEAACVSWGSGAC